MDVILIECVVKGYHECGFTVTAGETCIVVVIVVETLNSSLNVQCYRFTQLKNGNETVKKAIKSKENGLQQLKIFFGFLSFYREQSKSLVHYVSRCN